MKFGQKDGNSIPKKEKLNLKSHIRNYCQQKFNFLKIAIYIFNQLVKVKNLNKLFLVHNNLINHINHHSQKNQLFIKTQVTFIYIYIFINNLIEEIFDAVVEMAMLAVSLIKSCKDPSDLGKIALYIYIT